MNSQAKKIQVLKELFDGGEMFVMANPWDIGSTVLLERLGFKALATTSAGMSFATGVADGCLSLDEMLVQLREIVSSTVLPVNADFQNGFGDSPEEIYRNVKLCIETRIAGLSIEDATGRESEPLYEKKLAVERIKAARSAIDDTGIPAFLTARCESWFENQPDAFRLALERLTAFADAGADCVFAPCSTPNKDEIKALVNAVSPKPVMVVASAGSSLTVGDYQDAGVGCVMLGSGLAKLAWGSMIASAHDIANTATFSSLKSEVSLAELNSYFVPSA